MRKTQRAWIFAIVALLVAGCESDTGDPTTTPPAPATTTSTSPPAPSTTVDPVLSEPLPTDPDVRGGSLDNGLAYYIAQNDSPGGRAELRLLVDAGSVQEDPDQAGMAHFLEHMMFNGTERFPRNELISALESFGPRFGPDINAYTNYDETVYELSLSTADPGLVQLGIDVLREWAGRATLTQTDVVEERGVILDEWRLRAQGFGARVIDELQGLILPGTAYEGRPPIGTADSIRTTSPDGLERFYEDWYRPERMAVVAVGDFEVDEMESLIADAFGGLRAEQDPRPWDRAGYQPPEEPRVASHRDEEATNGGITVIWPADSHPARTVGEYQRSVATSLGLQVLGSRLDDDALGDGPLLGASIVDSDWTRAIAIRGVDTQVRPDRMDEGLVDVLSEVERIRREGITDQEFERALTSFETVSQQLLDQADSVQDAQIAAQLVSHHLAGAPMMSPSQRFEVESGIARRLSRQDVEEAIVSMTGGAPALLVIGPDDLDLDVPAPDRILEVLEEMPTMVLEPREPVDADGAALMATPDPAPVEETLIDPQFEFTTLRFANGADVYLWESDIAAESVYLLVEGFGGTSVVDVEDLPEAHLMTDIVARSGVGDIDVPTLQRLLADRIVTLRPWVSETRHGLEGSASTGDVETLLQLVNLTMTAPRFDQTAIDAVLDEIRALNAAREDLPDLLFEEAVNDAYYGEDPRYFVVPSPQQVEEFDPTVAEQVFRDSFSNAGDFAFAFVGDFETGTLIDLVARYIGTLPGDPESSGFVDNQPLPSREVQVTTVEAGSDEQGQLGMFFTNELEPVLEDRVAARLTELILTSRLRDRIREELSATYSISASIDLQRDPDPFAEAFVITTGDPDGLDEISEEVIVEIAALQQDGPTDTEFDTAVEQLRDELDLLDNGTIADRLITAHLYPDQPVSELRDRHTTLTTMTPADVREMANLVYDLGQRIEVRQVPRG